MHLIFGITVLVLVALAYKGLTVLVKKKDLLDNDFGLLTSVVAVVVLGLAGFTGLIVAGYGFALGIVDIIMWIGEW